MNESNYDNVHRSMVARLMKKGEDILKTLSPEQVEVWHMSSCICGEAGELFDAIKKWAIYNKQIDMENVIEELGDLEFYIEGVRNKLGIQRQDTIKHNYDKLSRRYEGLMYSDKAAQERVDKQ